MIDEECLYDYLKNNVDWLCPCDNCLYWLRNLFREFEFTFTNQWMKYLERKLFQKRFTEIIRKNQIMNLITIRPGLKICSFVITQLGLQETYGSKKIFDTHS